jgi:PAS domain S-box-containing protein
MQEPENFNALFNTADGVYIVNPELRIVYWNKGAERILGHSEKDVLNHDCFRIISGRENTDKLCCHTNCKVRSYLLKGMPVENFELKTHDKIGEEVWLNVSTLFSQKNGNDLIVHLIRDITQEKRVRKAADHFLAEIGIDDEERSKLKPERLPVAHPDKEEGTSENPLILSKREIEVLTLMAEGLSTKALAQQLNISHFTARNHIQNILEKLNLHSKSQAVAYAFKKGLL